MPCQRRHTRTRHPERRITALRGEEDEMNNETKYQAVADQLWELVQSATSANEVTLLASAAALVLAAQQKSPAAPSDIVTSLTAEN